MFSKVVKYNVVGVYYLERVDGLCEFLLPQFNTSVHHYDIDYDALEDVIVCLMNLKSNHIPQNGKFVISLFIAVDGKYSTSYHDAEWEEQYHPLNYSIRILTDEEGIWLDEVVGNI
jgi:hypothetical protein